MLKIKAEAFKDIVGYEGLYQIGDKRNSYRFFQEVMMTDIKINNGY